MQTVVLVSGVPSSCGDARMNNFSRLSTDMHKMCPGRLCLPGILLVHNKLDSIL